VQFGWIRRTPWCWSRSTGRRRVSSICSTGLGPATLTRDAGALGLGPDRVRQLLGLLADGGVLDDASSHAALATSIRHRTPALDRLRPDLAALSVLHPGPAARPPA